MLKNVEDELNKMLVLEKTFKCNFRSRVWRDIGKLIFNLSQGSDLGYGLFLMYSQMDPRHPDIDKVYYYCYECWLAFEKLNAFPN